MKVLVLYQDINSGSKVATEAILTFLKKASSEVTFVIYKQAPQKYSGRFSFLRNLIWSIIDFRRVIHQTTEIDLIYTAMYTSVIGYKLGGVKIPLILHLHGDQSFYPVAEGWHHLTLKYLYSSVLGKVVIILQSWAIIKADHVIFVSKTARQQFLRTYSLDRYLPKTSVVSNGVSTDLFYPVTKKIKQKLQQKYLQHTAKVILYVGRIDEKKGIHQLIEAYSEVSVKNVHLVIAYTSCSDDFSKSYLKCLKLLSSSSSQKVTYIENPKRLHEIYQLADCVVLPSKQEMLPLVMLESLASGIPFITTRVGGIPEILTGKLKAYLISDFAVLSLKIKIESILKLPIQHRQYLINDGLKVAHSLNWEQSTARVMQLFSKLTQRQSHYR
ncbi:MAG: glycosyltransferase family 4 protein [bacterium]|nr:glycosyltransferase family 4 protein [bacterium]